LAASIGGLFHKPGNRGISGCAAVFRSMRFSGEGTVIYKHACGLGCEGIVSKRLGTPYRAGRSPHWLKIKNPNAPAVRRLEEPHD
jgi:ATP-dependent DNA ligase